MKEAYWFFDALDSFQVAAKYSFNKIRNSLRKTLSRIRAILALIFIDVTSLHSHSITFFHSASLTSGLVIPFRAANLTARFARILPFEIFRDSSAEEVLEKTIKIFKNY